MAVLAHAITHPQLSVEVVSLSGTSLRGEGVTGGTYGVYRSSNLIDWIAVPGFNHLPATPPMNTCIIPVLPAQKTGFFFLGPATDE